MFVLNRLIGRIVRLNILIRLNRFSRLNSGLGVQVTVPAAYPRQPSRVALTELRRLPPEPKQATPVPDLADRSRILAAAAHLEAAVNDSLRERIPEGCLDQLLGLQVLSLLRLFPTLL